MLAAYGAPQHDVNRLTSLAEVPDQSQHPGEVDTYRESARSLEEVALSPDESVQFIADLLRRS